MTTNLTLIDWLSGRAAMLLVARGYQRLRRHLESQPQFAAYEAFATRLVGGVFRAVRLPARIERLLDPLVEISNGRRLDPALVFPWFVFMALLGLYPSQHGHLDTAPLIFVVLPFASTFNPFLGLVSGGVFSVFDWIGKFLPFESVFMANWSNGPQNFFGARAGYVIAYSTMLLLGLLPGLTSRIFRLLTRSLVRAIVGRPVAGAVVGLVFFALAGWVLWHAQLGLVHALLVSSALLATMQSGESASDRVAHVAEAISGALGGAVGVAAGFEYAKRIGNEYAFYKFRADIDETCRSMSEGNYNGHLPRAAGSSFFGGGVLPPGISSLTTKSAPPGVFDILRRIPIVKDFVPKDRDPGLGDPTAQSLGPADQPVDSPDAPGGGEPGTGEVDEGDVPSSLLPPGAPTSPADKTTPWQSDAPPGEPEKAEAKDVTPPGSTGQDGPDAEPPFKVCRRCGCKLYEAILKAGVCPRCDAGRKEGNETEPLVPLLVDDPPPPPKPDLPPKGGETGEGAGQAPDAKSPKEPDPNETVGRCKACGRDVTRQMLIDGKCASCLIGGMKNDGGPTFEVDLYKKEQKAPPESQPPEDAGGDSPPESVDAPPDQPEAPPDQPEAPPDQPEAPPDQSDKPPQDSGDGQDSDKGVSPDPPEASDAADKPVTPAPPPPAAPPAPVERTLDDQEALQWLEKKGLIEKRVDDNGTPVLDDNGEYVYRVTPGRELDPSVYDMRDRPPDLPNLSGTPVDENGNVDPNLRITVYEDAPLAPAAADPGSADPSGSTKNPDPPKVPIDAPQNPAETRKTEAGEGVAPDQLLLDDLLRDGRREGQPD